MSFLAARRGGEGEEGRATWGGKHSLGQHCPCFRWVCPAGGGPCRWVWSAGGCALLHVTAKNVHTYTYPVPFAPPFPPPPPPPQSTLPPPIPLPLPLSLSSLLCLPYSPTGTALGLVIYTGAETRSVLNTSGVRSKVCHQCFRFCC